VNRLTALVLAALALSACAKHQPRDERPCECGPAAVVDSALLAFLSQARSAHHVADAREAAGDAEGALRTLQRLTEAAKPPGRAPEVDEVLADTFARVAELLSQAGRFDEADVAIAAGLERAAFPNYFRGHLLEVRGAVEERREKALRGRGDGQEAERARERSLVAYEEAMKIQAQVIEESLRRAAPAPSSPK
jgi:tetratricopeptide (TPR) repeat protein